MLKSNYLFMAFGGGKETKLATPAKKYIGIAPVYVRNVVPTKKESEEFFGNTTDKDPVYLTTTEVNVNGIPTKINTVRIDFLVETALEDSQIEEQRDIKLKSKMTFFLYNAPITKSDGSKVKVIDEYGRTAWATKEELNSHSIPQYTNGPANITANYRPCYRGEEELTAFIKTLLNIDNIQVYINNTWVTNPDVNPKDCEARLDNITNYFKGDFSELKDIINIRPDNRVKVAVGIRTDDSGRQYQCIYSRKVIKLASRKISDIEEDINTRKSYGSLQNEEYSMEPLHEYVVNPTSFETKTQPAADPFNDFEF